VEVSHAEGRRLPRGGDGPRKRVRMGEGAGGAARASEDADEYTKQQVAIMAAIITTALQPHFGGALSHGAGRDAAVPVSGAGGGSAVHAHGGGGSGAGGVEPGSSGAPTLPPPADPIDLHNGWLKPGDDQLRAFALANRPSHSSRWLARGIVWLSIRPPGAPAPSARPVFPGPSPGELRVQWDALPAPHRTGDRLYAMCAGGSDRSGKWLLFPQADHVDEAWIKVRGVEWMGTGTPPHFLWSTNTFACCLVVTVQVVFVFPNVAV
jgi:hypothetical protein